MIRDLRQVTGGFSVVLGLARDWVNREATLRSWELFARYVIPGLVWSGARSHSYWGHGLLNFDVFGYGSERPILHKSTTWGTSGSRATSAWLASEMLTVAWLVSEVLTVSGIFTAEFAETHRSQRRNF
jgi:hypothetical protein